MADSKLLKEAIADAKAVRKTAIENARIALEEAFTPKLQSLLSQKLQAEMEGDEEEMEMDDMEMGGEEELEEELDSSNIGKGEGSTESGTDGREPSGFDAHTELDPETTSQSSQVGHEDSENEKVDDLTEQDEEDVTGATYDVNEEEFEDELDLESIIRELEDEIDSEEEFDLEEEEEFELDLEEEDEFDLDLEEEEEFELDLEEEDEFEMDSEEDFDDEIDLEEILREMGYDGDEEEVESDEEDHVVAALEQDLSNAYETIKELRKTINEVNLMNAKLLYTNKLFRSYDLDSSQKMKVVESLDRTSSVREVKLVFATLAESMSFSKGVERKRVRKLTEGFASAPTQSTKPAEKQIITESNDLADRFKKLAGINK